MLGAYVWTSGSLVLLAAAGLSLVVGWLVWRRRSIPGGTALAILFFAAAEWALVASLEAAAVDWSTKILWSRLEYVGSGGAAALYITFALQYSRSGRSIRRRTAALLWTVPILGALLAATNDLHHWVWRSFLPGPEGSNAILYVHGAAYYFVVAVEFLYLLGAAALLIRLALHRSLVHQRQAAALLVATLIPAVSMVLYTFGWNPLPGMNLIPTSLVVSGTILFLGIAPFRLFDLVPIARDTLVETLPDAVLVLDPEGRIVDFNPSAQALIGLTGSSIGRAAHQEISIWSEILGSCDVSQRCQAELSIGSGPVQRIVLHISPLPDRNGLPTGCVLVFRDITKRFRAEQELQEANVRLVSHVERIEALQAELREQAVRDPVTGLYNRRYLDDSLARELARAERAPSPVAAIMLDIDRFKGINDTFGHKAGDLMLQALADLLREGTRSSDITYRYGGEEFLIVLPQTDLRTAAARADELRRAFEAYRLDWAGRSIRATLSAGVSVFPANGRTIDELLRAADTALYAAKAAGRNAVHCADAPPETE